MYSVVIIFIVCFRSFTWPPSIIDAKLAAETFREERIDLLCLIRHCLPKIANALLAKGMISREVCDTACNVNKDATDRSVALLDCIESVLKVAPCKFFDLVEILKSEPFLELLAKRLINNYSKLCVL